MRDQPGSGRAEGHPSVAKLARGGGTPAATPYLGLHNDAIEQIAHDLKSPLWTIALETSLLDETLADRNHIEIRTSLARIGRNVDFLDRLVRDLIDSAALAAGQFTLQRGPTELRALLAQIVERVVSTRDRERVILDTPHPLTISIDAMRIERVVANLLQNALKYAPRASRIVVRLEVESHGGRVSVVDDGPGMTAAETSHAFDKYHRGASVQTHEGSGLGLYVSKQIVEAHGGTIGVNSDQGIGSRFFFQLPAR
jgi:signal transduction histidine kinase